MTLSVQNLALIVLIVTGLLFFNTLFSTQLPTDIVSYWTFDENTGSTAGDSVGENDGVLQGNVGWASNGKINSGLDFPKGGGDYVTTSFSPAVDDFTVGAWVRIDNTGLNGIFSTVDGTGTRNGFFLRVDGGDGISPVFYRAGDFIGTFSFPFYTHSSSLVDEWVFIVLVYEHGGTDSTFHLYVDGAHVQSQEQNGQLTSFQKDLWIGSAQQDQTERRLGGNLDEAFFYDRILTVTEIEELHAEGEGNQYPFTPEAPPEEEESSSDGTSGGTGGGLGTLQPDTPPTDKPVVVSKIDEFLHHLRNTFINIIAKIRSTFFSGGAE